MEVVVQFGVEYHDLSSNNNGPTTSFEGLAYQDRFTCFLNLMQ